MFVSCRLEWDSQERTASLEQELAARADEQEEVTSLEEQLQRTRDELQTLKRDTPRLSFEERHAQQQVNTMLHCV